MSSSEPAQIQYYNNSSDCINFSSDLHHIIISMEINTTEHNQEYQFQYWLKLLILLHQVTSKKVRSLNISSLVSSDSTYFFQLDDFLDRRNEGVKLYYDLI